MRFQDIRLKQPFTFRQSTTTYETKPYDLHVHDCLEINVVLKNRIENRFGTRSFIGQPGDVFICRPFEPHWGRSADPEDAEWIMILFTPAVARMIPGGTDLLLPFYTDGLPSPFIPSVNPHAQKIVKAAEDVVSQQSGSSLADPRGFMRLIGILLNIQEFARNQSKLRSGEPEFESIVQAVKLLLSQFREEVSIEAMMDSCGMAKTKFFHHFRLVTGTTPNDFLVKMRLQEALDLLTRYPERPVLQICLDSGFQSLRTFNKRFKEYMGYTPSEFKESLHDTSQSALS